MEKNTKNTSGRKSKISKKNKSEAAKSKVNSKDKQTDSKSHQRSVSTNKYSIRNPASTGFFMPTTLARMKTPPFVAGSTVSKSHNISLKLQELKKAKRVEKGELINRSIKELQGGKVPTKSASSNTGRIREMFVCLHNELSELLSVHALLKHKVNGEQDVEKLQKLEARLDKKELQINAVVQLYEENLKLREELLKLRKKEKGMKVLKKTDKEEEPMKSIPTS